MDMSLNNLITQPHNSNSLFFCMEFLGGKSSFFCYLYGIFTTDYESGFFFIFLI